MKTWVFVLITVLVIAVILVFVNWPAIAGKLQSANPADSTTGGNNNTSGGSNSGGTYTGTVSTNGLQLDKVLRNGSSGEEVKQLQRYLNQYQPANALSVDGKFGAKTEAKLFAITKQYSISLSGLMQKALNGFR